MRKVATPEPAELCSAFHYDRRSGELRWLTPTAACISTGDVAGTINGKGYRTVSFRRRTYQAHRIIWAVVMGQWPDGQIDHIDGDRANNAWANLRLVDNGANQQNRYVARKDSQTGVQGVSWYPRRQKFLARITVKGRRRCLGYFATLPEAQAAYDSAKQTMHIGR